MSTTMADTATGLSAREPVFPDQGDVLKERWRVEGLLAEGGMARVYEASDLVLHCPVVVKVPSGPRDFGRLVREGLVGASLHTRGVCKVLDLGLLADGATPFVALERLWGETLGERLLRKGPLAWREAVGLVRAAAVPLEEAHRSEVVHRDVKPENLFVTGTGEVYVLDFGVAYVADEAALTEPGVRVGTAAYMAPEYIMNPGSIDGRADIYALGLVLACAVAGREAVPRPQSPLVAELLRAVYARGEVRKLAPEVPEAVAKVIERASAVYVDERYQTMAEFRAALDGLLAMEEEAEAEGQGSVKEEVPAEVEGGTKVRKVGRGAKPVGRRGVAIAAVAMMVAILGAGVVSVRWVGKVGRQGVDEGEVRTLESASWPAVTPAAEEMSGGRPLAAERKSAPTRRRKGARKALGVPRSEDTKPAHWANRE